MYAIIWEFVVRGGREIEFETAYGPDGEWAALFRRGDGYLGTELLRATNDRRVYRIIDRWTSEIAYHAFMKKWAAEYAAIDRACEGLTERERCVGTYTSIQ